MPSFDVVSEIDFQEVRNAVDQASREVANRYDFKGTDSRLDLGEASIEMHSDSEGRLDALRQVLEEKLVRRKVSLKAVQYGSVEEAAKGPPQSAAVAVGSTPTSTEIGKFLKGSASRGPTRCRATSCESRGRKRDEPAIGDLGDAGARLRDPLQFTTSR